MSVHRPLLIAVALAACSSTPRSVDRRPYSERLADLVGPTTPRRELVPVLGGRDFTTIDPWAGAGAGVRFGQSMEEVISVWGQPDGLEVRRGLDRASRRLVREIRLSYGFGLSFVFRDNVLTAIHAQGLPGAHLAGGPTLGDSPAAVKAVLGAPARTRSEDKVWEYDRPGVTLSVHFLTAFRTTELRLAVITIERPGTDGSIEL